MKRIALVGCSKSKRDVFAATPEILYSGTLMLARIKHCVLRNVPWFVLSAKYGLVHQNESVANYDTTFADLSRLDRLAWPLDVARELLEFLDEQIPPREITIEIHAGNDYAEPLSTYFKTMGFVVERFGQGLGIGQQVAQYLAEIDALENAGVNG